MDIRRSVSEFVTQGTGLFHQLRSKGETLSDIDLVTLREQLHILDAEAGHLQDLKDVRSETSYLLFNDNKRHTKPQRGRNHH